MKVMYERVAGIDVHKDMIKVAVRSPGDKPWTRKTEILTFRTFYGVLRAMARELRRRGVTHVVMEASGVYTEPVYYALCEQDFDEVARAGMQQAELIQHGAHRESGIGGSPRAAGRWESGMSATSTRGVCLDRSAWRIPHATSSAP